MGKKEHTLFDQIQEALAFIRAETAWEATAGIILGTGLGDLANQIEVHHEIDYAQIPHFPISTVQSHASKLIFGTLDAVPIIAMAGRFHYYEGYSMKEVTFPIRVLQALGIQRLFISNVAGSVNPNYSVGDLIFITDHINLHPENPLRGTNDERLGPRFPDMLHAYNPQLIAAAQQIAKDHQIQTHTGVYTALAGPNLETPAEYRFVHRIGGDLIGMSTVPEVLVARHMNMDVMVISVVSNQCFPIESIQPTTVEDVIKVAKVAEPKLTLLVKSLLKFDLNH